MIWSTPTHLDYGWSLPENTHGSLVQLGVEPRLAPTTGLLQTQLAADWDRDLSGQVISEIQLAQTFDYFLTRTYGNSPRRAAAALEHTFYGLIGVNRNPGNLVPALRTLLPHHPAQISSDGLVMFNGLHFESPLLAYFPGEPVTLQLSPDDASTAWVYLNGGILDETRARELKRADGTYRHYYPEQTYYAQDR